ncbi:MAG TPA: NeuD/PglB/VioB family sugar acetyltransferase [Anaerolineales bacterium]|nr:NeuD/PglB/VioB family sugar acetyltransferase [Anaerolineales bacterium]
MNEAVAVLVPLLNPNEPESQVVALHVAEGQRILAGEALCVLETTKAAQEVTAEREGYVVDLAAQVGDRITAGARLCWIAPTPDWRPPTEQPTAEGPPRITAQGLPQGLRITDPALALAREANLDLASLPLDRLVTQAMVRSKVKEARREEPLRLETPITPTSLIVYGGGGHGKTLIELVRLLGDYALVGVVDDGLAAGERVLDVPVLGGQGILIELARRGVRMAVNAVGGVGDVSSRVRVFERLLEAGFSCPALTHPTAFCEPSARVGAGAQVLAHAYLGSDAEIGFGVIVNTGAVVSHDCQIGDHTNLAPGALLAGGVKVGKRVLIGMGVTINLDVKIGDGARIGNGATVKRDVPAGSVVRAGATWPA